MPPVTPTATPTPIIDPEDLASGYGPTLEGEWGFHVTTRRGWGYDVEVQASAAVAFRVFEPAHFPPGIARAESATIGGAFLTVTETVEDKDVPDLNLTIRVAYTGVEGPTPNTDQCQSYSLLDTGPSISLHCAIPVGNERQEAAWAGFSLAKDDIDVIEAQVAAFEGETPDLFVMEVGTACTVALMPDGTVGLNVPDSPLDRGQMCSISGPGTYTLDTSSPTPSPSDGDREDEQT